MSQSHYTSGHGTAVASADTSTTIFEVGRRRTPPVVSTSTTRTWLSGPHDVALGRRAAYRVAAPGGAPESVFSQPPLPEVIGEALTRAPVCRPEEHVVVKVARQRQERPIRKWLGEALGLGRFDVHLRQRSGVDDVLGFQQ
ncbi:hypothetical protein EVAR_17503_1 [Eumeta japonica]|uniref:Uncharacterized protein n=1 Tax=Eumeta variegata TaxID=151549 RepID=A0A4C1WPW8_EUMVA|nr:hypothetical protein EVAR_17503_1 [Eumeta japonica]